MYNKKVLIEATRNLNKVKVRVKKRPPANQDNTIPSRSGLDAFVYPTMDNTSLMKEGGEKQFVNSKEHGVDAPEYFQVQTAESPIHGTGVFTNEVIPAGSPIGVTHIRKTFEQNGNTYKAPFPAKVLGGYNHSENPNVIEVDNGDHIVMVALKDIEPGEELVSNYNDNTIEDLEKPEDFKNELTKANMGLITKGVKPVLNLATHKNPAKRFIGQRLVDAGVKQLPKASKGVGKVIQAATKTSKPLSKQLTLPLDFTSNISKLTHGISPEQMQMIQSKFNVPIEPNPPTYTDFLNLVNSKLDKGIGIKKIPINLKLAFDKPNLLPDKLFTGNDHYFFDVLSDLNTPGKFDKIGEIDLDRFTQDPDRKTFEKVMDYPFKHLPRSNQSRFKGLGISGELNKGLTDALQFYGMNPLLSSDQHTAEGLKRWEYLESIGAARKVFGGWETPRWELLSWALPLIGTGVGAYGLSNPWQQEQPNYLLNRRHGGSTGQPLIEDLPKARFGLSVPKIKPPKVKTPKIKPNITGIDAEIANLSKMTNTGLLDDFMITTDLGFKPSRDYSSVLHKLKDKEKDLGLSMWAPENAQKFTGDPINALTYSVLGPAIYGGNKLMNRILPTGVNTDLRKTITGHMDQRLSQQLSDTFLDPNQPIPLWDSNTTFHLGKKYGVDWQGYSDGFIERHNQNLLNQNTRVRDLELRAKRREWAKENNLTYDYKTDSYTDADGYMIPSPNFEAETQLLENPFDQSEIVQSGLGNLLTKPLTLFGKNELTPGNHLYRKIGNSAGLRDLINKGGAQAPGPLRMNSGFTINTPFFGVGESPNESYRGMYAVETPLPSKSKYDWTSRAGATNNYGVAPVDPETGALIENVPLEELNVYKRKPFSNNYKKLDPQNLEEGLKYADTQNLLENLWKWGVRGGLGYGALQLGKDKKLEEEKFGGNVNIGDEVDEATMQRLMNEGYTFEEL